MARILIVDDSSITRKRIGEILKNAGHEIVAEAGNGLAAYVEYERHQPDLVTMDTSMQGADGIEAVKKIVRVFPDAKIIMVSALEQKSMILAALENGAKHYVIKPFRDQDILAKVDQVLGENPQEDFLPVAIKITPEAKKPVCSQADSLTIENKNGIFFIDMKQAITAKKMGDLQKAVDGLAFVKPCKIVFNFKELGEIGDNDSADFEKICQFILAVGGETRVIAPEDPIAGFLRDKLGGKVQIYPDFYHLKF